MAPWASCLSSPTLPDDRRRVAAPRQPVERVDPFRGDPADDSGDLEPGVAGWWCVVPIAAVMVWLWLNPRVFAPVETPTSWTSKGIYGEKLWLKERERVPPDHLRVLRLLCR